MVQMVGRVGRISIYVRFKHLPVASSQSSDSRVGLLGFYLQCHVWIRRYKQWTVELKDRKARGGWADSFISVPHRVPLWLSEQMCGAGTVFLNSRKVMWRPAHEKSWACQTHTHTHMHIKHQPTTTACCVVNHCPLAGLLRYGKLHMGFIQSIYFTGLWSRCCHQVRSLSALSVKCSCDGPCVQPQMWVWL